MLLHYTEAISDHHLRAVFVSDSPGKQCLSCQGKTCTDYLIISVFHNVVLLILSVVQ